MVAHFPISRPNSASLLPAPVPINSINTSHHLGGRGDPGDPGRNALETTPQRIDKSLHWSLTPQFGIFRIRPILNWGKQRTPPNSKYELRVCVCVCVCVCVFVCVCTTKDGGKNHWQNQWGEFCWFSCRYSPVFWCQLVADRVVSTTTSWTKVNKQRSKSNTITIAIKWNSRYLSNSYARISFFHQLSFFF